MRKTQQSKGTFIQTAGLGLGLLFLVYFYSRFLVTPSGTLCVLKSTFGIPCPGCGTTRAVLAFLSGDWAMAFYWHPLWVLSVGLLLGGVILLVYAVVGRRSPRPWGQTLTPWISRLQALYTSNRFWLVLLVLYLGLYGVRMGLYFPLTAPMDYQANALFPRLLHLIINP